MSLRFASSRRFRRRGRCALKRGNGWRQHAGCLLACVSSLCPSPSCVSSRCCRVPSASFVAGRCLSKNRRAPRHSGTQRQDRGDGDTAGTETGGDAQGMNDTHSGAEQPLPVCSASSSFFFPVAHVVPLPRQASVPLQLQCSSAMADQPPQTAAASDPNAHNEDSMVDERGRQWTVLGRQTETQRTAGRISPRPCMLAPLCTHHANNLQHGFVHAHAGADMPLRCRM
jgi:hypothetical protein